jgi:hypothetical protein
MEPQPPLFLARFLHQETKPIIPRPSRAIAFNTKGILLHCKDTVSNILHIRLLLNIKSMVDTLSLLHWEGMAVSLEDIHNLMVIISKTHIRKTKTIKYFIFMSDIDLG